MPTPAEAALAQAESLLQAHTDALRANDADALLSLAAALRGPLAVLSRQVREGVPLHQRQRLQALTHAAAAAHLLAQRRAQAVQGALEALGQGTGRFQEARLAGTYGRTGNLQPGWRSTGCETA